MATFTYDTYSEGGRIDDEDAVAELLDEYHPTVETAAIEQGQLVFRGEWSAFEIEDDEGRNVTRDFLEAVQPYLDSTLEVRCLQTGGHGRPEAWKWVVPTDGDVERDEL